MDDTGKMTTVRKGKNGFTCMVIGAEKMCADANSMAFFDAWMKHQPPPDKLGLTYMLAGDDGATTPTLTPALRLRTIIGWSRAHTSWL